MATLLGSPFVGSSLAQVVFYMRGVVNAMEDVTNIPSTTSLTEDREQRPTEIFSILANITS